MYYAILNSSSDEPNSTRDNKIEGRLGRRMQVFGLVLHEVVEGRLIFVFVLGSRLLIEICVSRGRVDQTERMVEILNCEDLIGRGFWMGKCEGIGW